MSLESNVYPEQSREEKLIPRRDPVFYGRHEDARILNGARLAEYERQGFVIIPDVISPAEVSVLKGEMARLDADYDARLRAGEENALESAGRSLNAVHKTSKLFARLGGDKRIVNKVQQILASPVYLHHSQINIADTTNGNSWPWHSQFETWHAEYGFPRMRCVEAWVMLTDSTPYNGPMRILQKSHQTFVACTKMRSAKRGGPSLETLDSLLASAKVVNAYGAAGSLVLCDSNLMCGSTASAVPFPRALVMYSYNSVENLPADHERSRASRSPAEVPAPMGVIEARARTGQAACNGRKNDFRVHTPEEAKK